jgi:histidinol phosphatase-like enzyme
MEIIVPAAGLSSRFPNMRPKYSLVDYSGKLMLESAIKPFIGKYNITIGILKEHNEKYNIVQLLKHELKDSVNIVVLEKQTTGPADTVYQIIKKLNIDLNNEILIKDCDSFFDHEYARGNYICISRFSDNILIRTPAAKSYITTNEQGIVQNIVEKQVISDKFCVGGYKFESAKLYCNAFEQLSKSNEEIYVSNIIQYCLFNGSIFFENLVTDYIDVGTSEEWFNYNDKAVVFCDIDGTIIKAQSKSDYNLKSIPLEKNIECIKKLIKEKNQVIFVTARPENSRKATESMLNDIGLNGHTLIMGLQNCKRILINDFNSSNPYPRAIAINIPRDHDTLNHFLERK